MNLIGSRHERRRGRERDAARHRRRLRPTVMALEGRELLSATTWTVNSLGDTGTGSGNSGDLRFCINGADSTTGDNIINFSVTGPITLSGTQLELSNTSGTETIQGPAAGVTVSGGKTTRVFQIDSGVTASISGLTITGGNAASGYPHMGGGLLISGTATLTNCTISGNSATDGGGLEILYGTATLTNCTVSGNSASFAAGGLDNSGTVTLTNCTISGNSISGNSPNSFGVGGLRNSGTVTLTNCTISGNSASTLGGGLFSGITATLTNTIVAGNTTLPNGGGSPSDIVGSVSGSYNLIGIGGSGGLQDGMDHNIVLTDLTGIGLAKLGDYGGPTQTMALLPGSPAIDAGTTVSEVQAVTITGSLGTFTLTFSGQTTGPLAFSATAAQLQARLNALSTIGGVRGSVTVTQSVNVYTVTFGGSLANQDLPQMTIATAGGGAGTIATLTNGNPNITTDQRGYTRGRSVDIGAFQDQGFVLTPVSGSTPQTTLVGTAFTNPLAVTVTAAQNTSQFTNPVDGGVIGFTVNPVNGASATLSAPTATITGGQTGPITATANTVAGNYSVTASVSGVTTPANFSLTNTPGAAATVAVVSGSPQSTTVNTGFASSLVALVTDTYGNPVPNVSVTFFAAPGGRGPRPP